MLIGLPLNKLQPSASGNIFYTVMIGLLHDKSKTSLRFSWILHRVQKVKGKARSCIIFRQIAAYSRRSIEVLIMDAQNFKSSLNPTSKREISIHFERKFSNKKILDKIKFVQGKREAIIPRCLPFHDAANGEKKKMYLVPAR